MGDFMDLKEQEYVMAIAKHRSITKAADELFITQPTLSIFINRLEARMGIRLFDRIGKQFIPTYAGELYIKKARELLVIQNEFKAELSDLISGYTGRLRFGLHSRRSTHLLPGVLKEFHNSYPQIEVLLTEDSSKIMEEKLLAGDLDLILTNRFFDKEKLEVIPVYDDRLIMSIRPDHPACKKAKVLPGHPYPWLDLKHVAEERFILQAPAQSIRTFTEAALAYAGLTPIHTFVIENMETATQMAAEGYGVAFNYESYIRYFHYSKPVSCFEVGLPTFCFPISIAYRKGSYLPAYASDFIRLVQEQFHR